MRATRTGSTAAPTAASRWTKSDADLESSGSINGLFALAAVPGAPAAVFASVHRQLWKSADGATTFAKSGAGLPLARVQTVASDADGRTLWAGTEGEGVWRSVDGGATWTESRTGMGAVNVQMLLTDPAAPGTVYAAAWGKGVYRSTDGGRSWALVGGPPPHPDVIDAGPRWRGARAPAGRHRRRQRLAAGYPALNWGYDVWSRGFIIALAVVGGRRMKGSR